MVLSNNFLFFIFFIFFPFLLVIKQNYDVQVSDEFSFRGNTAVLKCNIPKSAENYLSLTSWIRDELITISKTFSQGMSQCFCR